MRSDCINSAKRLGDRQTNGDISVVRAKMNHMNCAHVLFTILLCVLPRPLIAAEPGAAQAQDAEYWVAPMRTVHAQFTGSARTLAQFGDSITISMAFWAPLAGTPKNMSADTTATHALVKTYLNPDCWTKWRGPEFGNNGSMTIRWAHQNVDQWLKRLNPEAAVVMFGSNDVGQMDVDEYEQKTREVVQRCLRNGTIVLLTTAPPLSGRIEKSQRFAEAVRRIAREEKVPLIDFFGEILKRRPDDWDGTLPQFKASPGDEYQVPTLIARDGVHPSNPRLYTSDFSDEGLKHNGFALRNYLTLRAYAEVIGRVLSPAK
jgi:lysophospholipase L1-like esterase